MQMADLTLHTKFFFTASNINRSIVFGKYNNVNIVILAFFKQTITAKVELFAVEAIRLELVAAARLPNFKLKTKKNLFNFSSLCKF